MERPAAAPELVAEDEDDDPDEPEPAAPAPVAVGELVTDPVPAVPACESKLEHCPVAEAVALDVADPLKLQALDFAEPV